MNPEERRRYPRVRTELPLEYRMLNAGPSGKEVSEILDFSEGGVQFSSAAAIPSGVLMMFTINAGRPYHFLGTTVRSEWQVSHDTFAVGAALAPVDPEEVEDLKLLVDHYGKDS